jgi:hypothetical protein
MVRIVDEFVKNIEFVIVDARVVKPVDGPGK